MSTSWLKLSQKWESHGFPSSFWNGRITIWPSVHKQLQPALKLTSWHLFGFILKPSTAFVTAGNYTFCDWTDQRRCQLLRFPLFSINIKANNVNGRDPSVKLNLKPCKCLTECKYAITKVSVFDFFLIKEKNIPLLVFLFSSLYQDYTILPQQRLTPLYP